MALALRALGLQRWWRSIGAELKSFFATGLGYDLENFYSGIVFCETKVQQQRAWASEDKALMGHTATEEGHSFGHGGVAKLDRVWRNGRQQMTPKKYPANRRIKSAHYLSATLLCNRVSLRKLPSPGEHAMR